MSDVEQKPAAKPAKPVPRPAPESAPYWAAARERRLSIPRCEDCGAVLVPALADVPALPVAEGRVRGRVGPGQGLQLRHLPSGLSSRRSRATIPYVVALVELEEGPRLLTNVVGADPEERAL